jgi:sigma-B regulation protein RsbU (phosphoserine phosphatase)
VQGLFVTLASPERSAAGIAARLGAEVHQRLGPRCATAAWIAQLSTRGELSYCNAGHSWPLWVPADGSVITRLDCGGPLLGALPAARYEEERLRLLPGDVLLLASDGVLGARGATDRPFGVERLAETATSLRGLPLARLAEGVLEAVVEYSARPVPTDDLTALALRFHPGD